jgi:hypothetical protein
LPSPEASFAPASAFPRLWLVELLVLLAAGLFALTFHARLPGKLVEESDYLRLSEILAAEKASGDVVLLVPWWTERARRFVPSAVPVVGYLGSDSDPLTPHPRIWVLSAPGLPGASPADFEKVFLPGRVRVGEPRRLGNLELALYRNDRHRQVLFSAAERYASARVYLEMADGNRLDCPFDGRQHQCPGGRLRVSAEWHEMNFAPRHCLWLHPPGGNTKLVAEFPSVPRGTRLSLEGGIIWEYAHRRDPSLTVTRLGLEEADSHQPLAELSLPPGLEGLQQKAVSTEALPSTVNLKVWVESANPDSRETCVELYSLGPSVAEGP